jgi:organic radical activating enzyme
MLQTGTLHHGGIMVNYQCNAACRHCLYSCSPTRSPGYMEEQKAEEICMLLNRGNCRSVHIGGGEPFLNFDSLVMMVRALRNAGISLEYIETNAYWAADASDVNTAREKLKRLLEEGVNTLCISIDPYHAEHVPPAGPLVLAKLCRKTGMGFFLWKQEFLQLLSQLDPQKIYSREEMEKALSGDYVCKTAQLYGIGYGGRAINIEKEFADKAFSPADDLAAESSPCDNLLSTGHFHVDKDAYFIPPRCTGIRIPLHEVVDGIPRDKYLAFEALYKGGVSALLGLARRQGFTSDNAGHPSKFSLCFQLRHLL